MARPSSSDPLDKFRWSVSVDGFTRMGFTQCDVPSLAVTTKKYPEGGAHTSPRQIVDSVEYKPVTLTRGVTKDMSFHGWAIQFIEVLRGRITLEDSRPEIQIPTEFNGGGAIPAKVDMYAPLSYRREVKITHLNREGQPVKVYTLINAIPINYVPASSFSSDGDDMLSMESITLAYEGFTVESIQSTSNPFDVRDVAKRLIRRMF